MTNKVSFESLGISEDIIQAIKDKGYEYPSPIQEKVIPLLLDFKKDVIGQAQTGTGKTAAFAIPLIQNLTENNRKPQALILTPTRELALQVCKEIISLKGKKKLFVAPIYGGQSMIKQVTDLKKGVDIVVGTPGRVIDHLNRGTLDISQLKYLILDEADEMLNMGFIEDIEDIIQRTPENRKTLLFSATMPYRIKEIAKRYMGEHEHVKIESTQATALSVEQFYYYVKISDKLDLLSRIIDLHGDFYGIVFCQTKIETDEVAKLLSERGYRAEAIHGDISQNIREKILHKFKTRQINILVATDVAARGIDVKDLTHVVNFNLPQDPESYVHRIGRTGRAGKMGTAISLVSPQEKHQLVFIQKIAKCIIPKKEIPDINTITQLKLSQFKSDLYAALETGFDDNIEQLTDSLLEEFDSRDLIKSILKTSVANRLFVKDGRDIVEPQSREKRHSGNSKDGGRKEFKRKEVGRVNGRVRLFVAKGKLDQFTPSKLVEFLHNETYVPHHNIRDVKVLEKFSFVSVNEDDADTILRVFKTAKNKGSRSVVEKAKD